MYLNPDEREYELEKELKQTRRQMKRQNRDIRDLQFEHSRLHYGVMYLVSLAILVFLVWLYMSTMMWDILFLWLWLNS